MKKNRAGIIWIASVACMVSMALLLGGMSVYAVNEGTGGEKIAEAETGEERTDVIDEILADGGNTQENDDSGIDYDSVPVLTWDEYYALYPGDEPQNAAGSGIVGTRSEHDLSMEEAGILGLKEIYRIYGESMEGMQLVMWLENSGENQRSDVWLGYLGASGTTMEEAGRRKSYRFDLDAVTGEILYLHENPGETEYDATAQDEMLTESEILKLADTYAEQYGLADPQEVTGSIENEASPYWGKSDYDDIVVYRRNGAAYLALQIAKKTGVLRGYAYVEEGRHYIVIENDI